MIIVKVELWSAITGKHTELARMQIDNIGGTQTRGDYHVATMRGRDEAALHLSMLNKTYTHEAEVFNHPRLSQHVWKLVTKALAACGYDK
jgi:hypothetical protein